MDRRMGPPLPDIALLAQVAIGGGHRAHASGQTGHDVALVIPHVEARPADTPRRRAASNSGSGCGLAWGVVSPLTTVAAEANSGIARVNGSVKRLDLLVTTPQGSPFRTRA
jgi:hypothetical protein